MKISIIGFVAVAIFVAMAGSSTAKAQMPYSVSWVGDTWEAASTDTPPSLHMQYQINGMYVNPSNGTVYTNSYYDEDGEECGVYQGGNYVGQLANLGAYRRGGGVGVTTDGANYIFITMSQGGNYSPGVLNARGNLDYPAQVFTNNNNMYGSGISAITFPSAVPSNISQGSVITSGTGIPSGTTVTVSADRKTLTLSQATTKAGNANQSLFFMGTYANAAYSAGDTTLSFSTLPPGIVVGSYFSGGTGLSQAAKVTAINGNTVTLSRPMTANGAAGQLLTFAETWYCIRRYSLTLSGTTFNTAPVTTGTSAYGWDSTMAIVSTVNDVAGLAYANSKLYASDPINNRILIYSPTDLSLTGSFAITSPGPIAADSSGNLWIIQSGNSVVHYSSTGTNLNNTITSTSVAVPVSVSYDATGSGRLLVTDNGPDQQVKIFTTLTGTNPTVSSTFGTKSGFNASPAGVVTDLKFEGLAGAGADSSGNIYVGCNEFNNYGNMLPGGAELKSFPAGGSMATWKLYGLQFENIADFDPYTGGADIQSTDGHYTMNYAQPAGQQWTYYGFSLNPTLTGSYSQDARLNVAPTSVMLRQVNGTKIQYEVDQGDGAVYIYRFSGERAIPSGIIARNNLVGQFVDYPTSIPAWPPNQPAGAWIWCDANANGLMDATGSYTEYTNTGTNDPDSWGSWVDHDGDVWVAYTGISGIRRFIFQGLDSHGNPLYSRTATGTVTPSLLYNTPAPFTDIERMQYDSESDTMYLTGYTQANPNNGQWGVLGTTLAKYTSWTTSPSGTGTLAYTIPLPWNTGANPPVFAKSFTVAGEKIFVGDVKTATIGVYSSLTGTFLQTLTPTGTSSQLDSVQSLNSIETNGVQYLVLANENMHGKNYLYQVGGGITVTTYNGNDSNNNTYAGGASYNNNKNNVGTGAATFLSMNGSVTFKYITAGSSGSHQLRIDAANGDNTNRNISISVNGGAVTSLKCPSTGSWITFTPMWTTVTLNSGNNTIKLFGNGVNAPDIAHVAVAHSQ
jgi:hypothetical protein